MILIVGSFVVAGVSLLATWLISKQLRHGWAVSVFVNIVGIVYDIYTLQYGFAVVSVIGGFIAAKAWWSWQRKRKVVLASIPHMARAVIQLANEDA